MSIVVLALPAAPVAPGAADPATAASPGLAAGEAHGPAPDGGKHKGDFRQVLAQELGLAARPATSAATAKRPLPAKGASGTKDETKAETRADKKTAAADPAAPPPAALPALPMPPLPLAQTKPAPPATVEARIETPVRRTQQAAAATGPAQGAPAPLESARPGTRAGLGASDKAPPIELAAVPRHLADAPAAASATALAAAAQAPSPAAPAARTLPATAPVHLEVPFSQPAWPEGFAQKVVWMATEKLQRAELHLNPPELGPLRISLSVHDGQASAQFVAHHEAVREAIQAALPRLKDMLAGSGIALGNAMVSADSSRGGQDFQNAPGSQGSAAEAQGPVDAPSALPRALALPAHIGMVDIFA